MKQKSKTQQKITLSDETLRGMVKRRAQKANAFWEKKYNLKKLREDNLRLYDSSYIKDLVLDDRYEEVFADNRLFTSIRTIMSFIGQKIAGPDVTPADNDDDSIFFARDFQKILELQAKKVKAQAKMRLAIEDLLKGQRLGVLKWVYDTTRKCLALEYCDPSSILVDHTAMLYEEPKFVQHTQPRSLADLIRQFPDKKEAIYTKYQVSKGTRSQLEEEKDVTENWIFYDDGEESYYMVVWMLENDLIMGAVKDPNWMNELKNILEYPMTPFVFLNLLNDGKTLVDNTSLIEQAQYNQKNYDKLGQRIVEDAAYGGIGVPVFASGAIKQDEASKVTFSPIQRIILDTDDIGKSFTTWQSGQLPNFIPNEKYDSRNNVDNVFGTPNIFRAEASNNNTATQDVLIRDQAEGRQSEIVQLIEYAMDRFYQAEAMMIYRYYDEDTYFRYKGDDGLLVKLAINQQKISKHADMYISVEANSGMPLDKSQRRATAFKLLEINKISTLDAYKMLEVEDPEAMFKRYLLEQVDPKQSLDEVDKTIYDREADEDLAMVLSGKDPEERPDISDKYLNYLNEYLLTDKFRLLKPNQQQMVSLFVQAVLDKAQRKLSKLANMQEANAAAPEQQAMDLGRLPSQQSQEVPSQPIPQPQAINA